MSSPSKWNISSMHEPPVYTPRSITSELGPQSPTSGATKRPFSDVSNRTTSKKKTDFRLILERNFYFCNSWSIV
jgi:hypothetical protein